jgi:uncharacterized protein
MANILIIHGAYGNPEENWFPWLKKELEERGHRVIVPKFPTPENQTLENWLKIFKDYKKYLNTEAIMIGHSLGCSFILNVLENLDEPIKAVFLVAGWTGLLNDPLDKINQTFVDKKFDWDRIKKNCTKFVLFNSANDPYIPIELGKKLAMDSGGELVIVENAGHFNRKAGYIKFDLLLERI